MPSYWTVLKPPPRQPEKRIQSSAERVIPVFTPASSRMFALTSVELSSPRIEHESYRDQPFSTGTRGLSAGSLDPSSHRNFHRREVTVIRQQLKMALEVSGA